MGFGQWSRDGLGGRNETPVVKRGRERTTFGSHANTAHVWAQQTFAGGKSGDGRMYFEGATIFSYGSHFPIAHFVGKQFDGRAVVLFNANRYSVSTSKHCGEVRGALHGLPVLTVEVPNLSELIRYSVAKPDARTAFNYLLQRQAGLERDSRNSASDRDRGYFLDRLAASRMAVQAFLELFRPGVRVPADIVAWDDARREKEWATAERTKIQDALALIRWAGDREGALARLFAHEVSQYWLDQLDRDLKKIRSARLTLAKTKRHAGAVKRASALLKQLQPVRAKWVAELAVAAEAERRERDLTVLRDLARWLEKPDGREPQALWNYETTARLWGVAIREGMTELVPALQRKVYDVMARREITWPTEHDSEKKRITLAQWYAGQGSAHACPAVETAVRRKGDVLETSRGATVPWRSAVRVLGFAQQCRRDGKGWRRNGEQIPVGPYQLDSIAASGNIRAGCHTIAWDEMVNCAVREIPSELQPTFGLPMVVGSVL